MRYCCSRRRQNRSTCSRRPARARSSSMWRRVFITDDADLLAGLPALHPRRGRQRGPAAQPLARDAAEQSATGTDPQGGGRPRDRRTGEPEREGRRQLHQGSGTRSARCSRKASTRITRRREKLLALSRFTTTVGDKRSLKQYVEGLKPNQTEIYYLVGDSIERLKSNPKLEAAAAPRHRGAAAHRSGRCVLDLGADRFRRQSR